MSKLTKPLPILGMNTIEVILLSGFIAIFAMAALPRLSDSRLLADVARAKRDLASIAQAMEAYRLDNEGYPANDAHSPIFPHGSSVTTDRRLLTTPIAYLDQYPNDSFSKTETLPARVYRLYAVAYIPRSASPYYLRSYTSYPKTSWMAWSYGPDMLTNTGGYFTLPAIIANEAAPAHGPWITSAPTLAETDYDGRIIGPLFSYNGIRYDPTNGEISNGDIYHFGSSALWRLN